MQLSFVVVLALAICGASAVDIEEGVYVGTDENFQSIIESTEFVLAEFYAPWCGHCKTLAPEYAKAAKALADQSNVKLVKVDATVHSEISEQFEVQGYPTLKWIRNGKAAEYTGGRTVGEITSWVRRKSGPASAEAATVDSAKATFKATEVVIFGAFSDASSSAFKTFLEAASLGEIAFSHTFDANVASTLGVVAPSITVFKHFDEKQVTFDGDSTSAEAIAEFATAHSLPLLNQFSDETASKIFGGAIKQHLLLFANKQSSATAGLESVLKAVAARYRGKMLFVVVDSSVDENSRITEFFGLSESDLPAVRVIDLSKDMAKFSFSSEITEVNLVNFLQDYFVGNVKRHLNTQATPADWDAQPVKVLTGSNFAEVALNENKHAFVEFYAPWCGHCKSLAPVWDALAEKFASRSDLVIAKIDMTANELEDISVQGFPTIKLFKIGAKSTPVDYDGARELDDFVKYLEEALGAPAAGHAHDEF